MGRIEAQDLNDDIENTGTDTVRSERGARLTPADFLDAREEARKASTTEEIEWMSGVSEGAYYGKPWHGGGQILEHQPECPDEMRTLAGHTWEPKKVPLFYQIPGSEEWDENPDMCSIVRSDTGEHLHTVGRDFTCFGNEELYGVADAFRKALGGVFDSAFSIDKGRLLCINVAIPNGSIEMEDGSKEVSYWSLVDQRGTGSLTAHLVRWRAVCRNMVQHQLSKTQQRRLRIRHTKHARTYLDQAVAMAEHAGAALEHQEKFLKKLSSTEFTSANMADLAVELFGDPEDGGKRAATRRQNKIDDLVAAYQSAPGASPGTAYGALQAVSFYTTHMSETRSRGRKKGRFELAVLDGAAKSTADQAQTWLSSFVQ